MTVIVDAFLATIGIATAVLLVAAAFSAAWLLYDAIARTRPAWWIRGHLARWRLHRSTRRNLRRRYRTGT